MFAVRGSALLLFQAHLLPPDFFHLGHGPFVRWVSGHVITVHTR
jgi:hypothetical protein